MCGRKPRRSSEANDRYWAIIALLTEVELQGVRYGRESWHEEMKKRYLPSRDVRLPSGDVLTLRPSSSELDVDEFNDYMLKVEAYASETFGVFLPD